MHLLTSNPRSNPWAGMDDLFCVHHLRYNCYHLTGMEEKPKSSPDRDSFFKQAPSKGGYRYQLKVHQDNPNLLEQETKRETQKRDLSLWNFLKRKIRPNSWPKTMTSSIFVLRDRWHVGIYASCLHFCYWRDQPIPNFNQSLCKDSGVTKNSGSNWGRQNSPEKPKILYTHEE